MDEQLLQYQLFSNPNVILHYGLAGMTASHQQFQLPFYLKKNPVSSPKLSCPSNSF